MMTAAKLETLVWVLIYGGLLTLGLGLFVQRSHDPIGWTLIVGGGVATAVGVLLIWVRSRIAN